MGTSRPRGYFILIVLILFSLPAVAQSIAGPGFDPTPTAIPLATKASPRPITSMDLLTLRDLHGVRISPDGRYVAFVVGQAVYTTNSYRSGLFVVATEAGSTPKCLGTAGQPHWDEINEWEDDPPQWSPDSQFIYYRLKESGTWQVWRWDRQGGQPKQTTHIAGNVRSFRLNSEGTELVLQVEKASDRNIQQLAQEGILFDGSFFPGHPRPVLEELAQVEIVTWIHQLGDSFEHKATEKELLRYGPWKSDIGEEYYDPQTYVGHHLQSSRISPDGTLVAYHIWLDDPAKSKRYSYPLFAKPIRGGTAVPLTSGDSYITNYWWGEDNDSIFYEETLGDGHSHLLERVSVSNGTKRVLLHPDEHLTDYSLDRAARLAACIRDTNTTPPQVALADLSTGSTRVLVDLNPEFANLQLTKGMRIDVTNNYGDNFHSYLVLPQDYRPNLRYPLIITPYRSSDGFLRGDIGDEYPIHVFAAQGFAVLSFDLGEERSHRHGDFEIAVLQWASPTDGMRATVEKLTQMGIVDASRVGITGLSHGAEMAEYAISHTTLFHAAITSGPGARDPLMLYMGINHWLEVFADWGLGGWPEGESATNWRRLSPALNADHIDAPLLSNASDSEYLYELQLITSLKTLGKPVELFIYPNELHVKNQPKHRYEIYERNADWFNFWLQDKEDADPIKVEQYKRWRRLRTRREAAEGK